MIKNYNQLATSAQKIMALKLLETGLNSVLPKTIFKNIIYNNGVLRILERVYRIQGRIFIIGAGKASGEMAILLEEIIGFKNITAGVVNSTINTTTRKVEIIKAGHPLPNEFGFIGAKNMLDLKNKFKINNKDTIICLLSGGGSSLLSYPAEGVSLSELINLNKAILNCGADIYEINTVRKHISRVKGGLLAKHFYPAKVLTLIISDIIDNDISVIASGPTTPDKSTFQDALNVLNKYQISILRDYLFRGTKGRLQETPKQLVNTNNIIIADNNTALESMKLKADELYSTHIIHNLKGESSLVAKSLLEYVQGLSRPCTVLLGGETTVTLSQQHGKGGRNQEFILSSLLHCKLNGDWCIASLATDGIDFIEDAAGAIIDNHTLTNKTELRQCLDMHNSYQILQRLKAIISTGYTGTNVADLVVYVLF